MLISENFRSAKIQNRRTRKIVSLDRPRSSDFSASNRRERAEPGSNLLRVARVGAAFPPYIAIPCPWLLLTLGPPARLRVLPEASPSEPKGEAATRAKPTTRARRLQSARSPGGAPKSRGQLRASEEAYCPIAHHIKRPPRLTLKAGRMAGYRRDPSYEPRTASDRRIGVSGPNGHGAKRH